MPDRPAIGDAVHFTGDNGECQPMYVHAHLGTAHLHLADTPHDQAPARYWVACPSDAREPHSWHTPCS